MRQTWFLIAAAVTLVLLSSISTYAFIEVSRSSGEEEGYSNVVPRRFDVFEGYSSCAKYVGKAIDGEVLSVDSDDRAAKYDRSRNQNMLYFSIQYREKRGLFAEPSGPAKMVYARCDVSAETNVIETISIRLAEEKEYVEAVRRPE